ncbi:MAG TPA: DUF169 domain-containing protein [Desulfosalsimonadaceae bacterium]|nr:DUF169 domain-containing protein [Desulfosalsimonadaceae bacterium]
MDLQQVHQAMEKYLRPQSFPVAVRLLAPDEQSAFAAKQPRKDLGIKVPVCQAVTMARRYGWSLAMSQEDMLRPLGSVTLGFVPARQKFLDGDFNVPFWVRDREIRAKMAGNLPRLEYGRFRELIVAPLHKADFAPHVVIFYGNPAQLSRLAQSAVHASGEPVASDNYGGFACGAEITLPFASQQCRLVIAGGGDRALAQVQDHEGAFAIPANRLEMIVDGLEKTHKAGLRYPSTPFLAYQGQFPPQFAELMQFLENGEDK